MKDGQLDFVREMFEQIAPHYDFLNRLLSLRRDVHWRRQMVKCLDLAPRSRVLDVACGTADVALEIISQYPFNCSFVAGADFAPSMLALARRKINQAGLGSKIVLAAGDALQLPFAPGTFQAVTIAFGIRNIEDKTTVLEEFYRLLAPGGKLVVLELVLPDTGWLQRFYLAYFNRILPVVGRIFSKHSFAYSYLPRSVALFPTNRSFCAMMAKTGFRQVDCRRFTFGIAALFTGIRP